MKELQYTAEIASDVCAKISEGTPLTAIAKLKGMPSLRTLHRWAAEKEDFRELLRQAREDAATALFEEAREIADEAPLIIEYEGEKVTVRFDHAAVARNRERVRAREHAAAKLLPRAYGDKQTLAIGASPDLPRLPEPVDIVELARRIAYLFASAEHELANTEPVPLRLGRPTPHADSESDSSDMPI